MKLRFLHQAMFVAILLSQLSICLATEIPDPNNSSKYLNAVREFADNVLQYGRDTYGPKHTPLFVDGLNVHTHEPVKWINRNGKKWILSNLASQQTLLRTLDGLSKITGDPKYRMAAEEAVRYAFDNLRSPNGLLYWGHHVAYDAQADEPSFPSTRWHILKLHYPYYELMWRVDPNATKQFIEAFWSAHILDWSNLDMNRYAVYSVSIEEPWNHEYKGGPAFFKSKQSDGYAFHVTGSSLVYAGSMLFRLSGFEPPLVWSRRLAKRYVDTRHPNTGIAASNYNNPGGQLGDDLRSHFTDPHTSVFPVFLFDFRHLDYPEEVQPYWWMSTFLVGDMLGEHGDEFTQWSLEEFTAWGKKSYRKENNSFVPILTDGTSLEGYVWKEGPSGMNVAKPIPANPSYFWAYTVAYCATSDQFMWRIVRDIALGNVFGDIGETAADIPELHADTACSQVHALLGFLKLYEKTDKSEYLQMARRIGDNIVKNQSHNGFFLPSRRHIYTRLGCTEPLALLHLHVATEGMDGSIPQVWPEVPLFRPRYRHKDEGVDRIIIYTLTESEEPPLSLQEAAAVGDIGRVRTLVESGTGVDSVDDTFLRTALQRAAESGHKDVVQFLIAKGANLVAKGGWRGETPLHGAARGGHKAVVEILIAAGADVNAKNNDGKTPEDVGNERLEDINERLVDILVFVGIVFGVPLVIGSVLAMPLTFFLRKVADRPGRFLRYFIFFVVIFMVECAALGALILSLTMLTVWFALTVLWGIILGIWLRRRSSAKRVLNGAVAFAAYTSAPAVCFSIGTMIFAVVTEKEGLMSEIDMVFPLNTALGFALTLGFGTLLLKLLITTGEVALLYRKKHGAKE